MRPELNLHHERELNKIYLYPNRFLIAGFCEVQTFSLIVSNLSWQIDKNLKLRLLASLRTFASFVLSSYMTNELIQNVKLF